VARAIKLFIAGFRKPPRNFPMATWMSRLDLVLAQNGWTIRIPRNSRNSNPKPRRWLKLETEGGSNYKELRLGKYATIANLMSSHSFSRSPRRLMLLQLK